MKRIIFFVVVVLVVLSTFSVVVSAQNQSESSNKTSTVQQIDDDLRLLDHSYNQHNNTVTLVFESDIYKRVTVRDVFVAVKKASSSSGGVTSVPSASRYDIPASKTEITVPVTTFRQSASVIISTSTTTRSDQYNSVQITYSNYSPLFGFRPSWLHVFLVSLLGITSGLGLTGYIAYKKSKSDIRVRRYV